MHDPMTLIEAIKDVNGMIQDRRATCQDSLKSKHMNGTSLSSFVNRMATKNQGLQMTPVEYEAFRTIKNFTHWRCPAMSGKITDDFCFLLLL